MALIDVAKKHYENLGVKSFRVPEWENAEIFVKPMTLAEQSILYAVQINPKRNEFDLYGETVALKALDANGNRLFSPADVKGLMSVAKEVVKRIATDIVTNSEVEDLKNS